MPQLKVEQGPQPVAVVGTALHVLSQQALNRRALEIPARSCAPVKQHIVNGLPKLMSEPALQGHPESHFFAVQDLGRQFFLKRLLKAVF